MAALDFPASPTLNQTYPAPAVPGVPVYTWDGEKWTTTGGAVGSTGAADDPPLMDGTASVGSSTQWAREDHRHPSDTAKASVSYVDTQDALGVRYDVTQSLTAAQQQQARSNIYAAPFDALAYSGMQINGSMEISQELGTTARTTNGYICDGWVQYLGGTAIVSSVTSVSGFGPGFPNFLNVAVTTAQTTLGASDGTQIYQAIEGYRIARLAWGTASAQPITVAFWSSHVRTGVYSVVVRNAAGNRTYAASYTQAVSNVAQYNVITIPGCTDGVWPTTNAASLYLIFALSAGSTIIAPSANTWFNVSYGAAPGQVNATAATSDIFRITGVIVLPGNEAPSAARSPLIMRPYDQELVTCRRYLQTAQQTAYSGFLATTSIARFGIALSPTMRVGPTGVPINGALMTINHSVGSVIAVGMAVANAGTHGCTIDLTISPANGVVGQGCVGILGFGSMYLDARL